MSFKRYTEEFRIEAVRQVTEHGYKVYDVAYSIGVTPYTVYAWIRRFRLQGKRLTQDATVIDHQAEIKYLKAELRRVTEERDILKKATAYFAKESL